MSRFYDRLLSRAADPALREALLSAEVIDISNVAEYAAGSKEDWQTSDIPNIAPPFGCGFMEFSMPQWWLESGTSMWIARMGIRTGGVLWGAHDAPASPEYKGARWALKFMGFIEYENDRITHLQFGIMCLSGQDGSLLDEFRVEPFKETPQPDFRTVVAARRMLLLPALLSICFMNCRNVRQRVVVPPKSNRAVKLFGRPLVTYRVLEIDPMKKIIDAHRAPGDTGIQRALHVCRGHFKNYSGSGLFGKYKGMYWWDQQVRGSAEVGVALKDYKVRAAQGATA